MNSNQNRFDRAFSWLHLLCACLLLPNLAFAEIELTLKNSFIEKYKNRATITVDFVVDKAHKNPNKIGSGADDGDMHIAGRAQEVGLPMVAEIINAKTEKDAVQLIHELEGTNKSVTITGAWRIWTEHGGEAIQKQGDQVAKATTTNPQHVFEIHPVSAIGNISVLKSIRPVDQYDAYDAETAFNRYENVASEIKVGKGYTTIVTKQAGYNYVQFLIELTRDPFKIVDGMQAYASILDKEGEVLIHNRRMVFVGGTQPEAAIQNLKAGDCLHVLGIPRIDLSLVSWRVRNAAKRPGALKWSLPYEIIVIGVYEDDACKVQK